MLVPDFMLSLFADRREPFLSGISIRHELLSFPMVRRILSSNIRHLNFLLFLAVSSVRKSEYRSVRLFHMEAIASLTSTSLASDLTNSRKSNPSVANKHI